MKDGQLDGWSLAWRGWLCAFYWLGMVQDVRALSMVVTPGTSASYLYFPPALTNASSSNNAGTNTVVVAGVGGVSVSKAGGWVSYTVSVSGASSTSSTASASCGLTCSLGQFNTGAGFVTLQSSRPTTFTDALDKPLSNCTAVLNCTTWVNTNTTLQLRTYPNCFEGDYALYAAYTCTLKTTPEGINLFYGSNLSAVGSFGGQVLGRLVVYTLMPNPAVWESSLDLSAGKYGFAQTGSEGSKNKAAIQSVYRDKSIEDACSALGSAWFVPSDVELKLFVSLLPFNYYWTSNDLGQTNALAVFSLNQASFGFQKDSSLGVACVRVYAL